MNLTNFLMQTDSLTEKYTAEQLRMFIHDVARVLPEGRREDFLKQLKGLDAAERDEKQREEKEQSFIEASKADYDAVMKDFDMIEAGEVSISSELNEEYDDWYGGEEFFYEDPEDIGGMLQRACNFIHTCMDTEEYKKDWRLGKDSFLFKSPVSASMGMRIFQSGI